MRDENVKFKAMTVFKHSALNSNSFRLIRLKPSFSSTAPLSCQLVHFGLTSHPRYEALSYTWEGQTPCQPIQCDGSVLLVTPNVEASLRQLRRYAFRRYLWIDAVSIDQCNMLERSSQISLMDQIYRNARRVVIWLGEDDRSCGRALRTLKWVFPVFKLAFHFFLTRHIALRAFHRMQADFHSLLLQREGEYINNHSKNKGDRLKGLSQIVHHGWFRRIWTIQEIALSRKAIIQCGNSTIRWASLSTCLTFDGVLRPKISAPVLLEGGYNPAVPIYNKAPFMIRLQQIQLLQEWPRISQHSDYTRTQREPYRPVMFNQSHRFLYNLILAGLNPEFMTTDPKDRIFGLLPILHTLGFEFAPPEYRKSLEEVVLDTFTTIALKQKSLVLLNFVTGENSRDGLPSWIPDFSLVPWCPSKATTPWETLECEFTIDGRRLLLAGIHVDTIGETTETIGHASSYARSRFHDAFELSTEYFVTYLQRWLDFVQLWTRPKNLAPEEKRRLLYKLLLHSQVLAFYGEAFPLSLRGRLSPDRLFQHFCRWVDHIESKNEILMKGDDYISYQAQHFISGELIMTGSYADLPDGRDLGYERALLTIQRWVREHITRKRLFVTKKGHLGIGWQALKKGDLIILVAGLRSPLILRRTSMVSESYQVIGPCEISSDHNWEFDTKRMSRFELI